MKMQKAEALSKMLIWSLAIAFSVAWGVLSAFAETGETKLVRLRIRGPLTISPQSTTKYRAYAKLSNGRIKHVTRLVKWSLEAENATIDASGRVTTQSSDSNTVIGIKARYAFHGRTKVARKKVTFHSTPNTPPTGSHVNRISAYEGTKTCLQCHETQAREVHASAHYQWKGDSRDIINTDGQPAGKLGGINDFCIFPDINWIGKLTNVDGVQVDGGCARCHVGLGDKPDPTVSQAQLENIDCLICHSPGYKRKVDTVNGGFRFVPDTARMTVSTLQAATDIHLPTKDTCLNCHTGAGGGNNYKRGDIEEAHRNPTKDFDVHMSLKANGGAELECLDCHSVNNHRIAGRGTDLRERDSLDLVSCTNCHNTTPHGNTDLDQHTARVNCTVCHIPTFAKAAPTDMNRDWSLPAEIDVQKRLYDPSMDKQSNVAPEYQFFDGKSTFYRFGDSAMPGASGRILMSGPHGDVATPGARIYAFKHHLGTQPIDPVTNQLLPLKIGIFFQNGDLTTAVQGGIAGVGWTNHGFNFAHTERYMGLFHEVAPKDQALSCNSCHNGGTRLNFAALGYTPKTTNNGKALCASCHGAKTGDFTKIHWKHVTNKKFDCSSCHNFSKAN